MNKQPTTILFERLATLYACMDKAWETAAAHYGFVCKGCADNCCATEFYHYTYIEKHYLISGLKTLTLSDVETIKGKAKTACTARDEAKPAERPIRVMCPLNSSGLCQLYKFRPMICRLHGIPHELKKPGTPPVRHQGCPDGTPLFKARAYYKFDRTPLYSELAKIEMEYRRSTGNQTRMRQSIAEMLIPGEQQLAGGIHY